MEEEIRHRKLREIILVNNSFNVMKYYNDAHSRKLTKSFIPDVISAVVKETDWKKSMAVQGNKRDCENAVILTLISKIEYTI
ncbi:uncharacterized protein PHACADRAFT_198673 [Phanerochaete carnosa HHB-10118-sp]|uniref:Uncharacterized protein n=1 Tax=Phanerochaete carnosa (strain HHB-10118-sp) TaxID=650164 RepID=K5WQJ0_PHACS|nr:uncharacterized protein PHACADRAFT_198673 [Phanerochaete carnosa HHB-10118-sp]EKM52627.1 hypothetical protein PHACADRAFT_198673 [Phanerochaete carnosa HHB-10118-sp]